MRKNLEIIEEKYFEKDLKNLDQTIINSMYLNFLVLMGNVYFEKFN
jgi:hypothetical protein